MSHPPVDRRDRAALAAQTTALATAYSGWRPGPADVGRALVEVFAGFAELVVERINRAPDRNYLAFLNLIGTEPLPPLPARVPLTFTLAEGGPGSTLVPAGTRVAAQALPGDTEEIAFSTEADLVVTGAALQAVVVGDAENDTWSDRTTADAAWPALVGDRPVPHELYVACDAVLAAPDVTDVTLVLSTPAPGSLAGWPVTWSCWDGAGWRPVAATATVGGGAWRVTLTGLPRLPPCTVGTTTASWVRATLDLALPRGRSGLPPEAVAAGNRAPRDDVAGLEPFGEGGRWFYLSVDEALAAGGAAGQGATAQFDLTLDRPGTVAPGTPVRVAWSYKVGSEWRPLGVAGSDTDRVAGQALNDTSRALTRNGTVGFTVPAQWPRETHRGRIGRWLRAELVAGDYATPPRVAAIVAGHHYELPTIGAISVAAATPPAPQPPAAASAGGTTVDLTMDVLPFGQQPAFNDTLYLACPDELAGAPVAVTVAMTNAGPGGLKPTVRTDGDPGLVWEAATEAGWRPVTLDRPAFAFTADASLQLTPPPGWARTEVGGRPGWWLRVRLVRGNYGKPADYTQRADGGWTLVPASYAPPMVRTLTFAPGASRRADAPATACVSRNDVVTRDHEIGSGAAPFTPFTPGPDADPALYLGFDRPFDPLPVTLYLQVEQPAPEDVAADRVADVDRSTRPELVWEYSAPGGWSPLAAVDRTGGLAASGTVEFVGPADLVAADRYGRRCHWLRLRWRRGEFPLLPQLRRVLPNTVVAVQAVTVSEELLGSGTGDPGQTLTTAQAPVLAGHRLDVREGDRWTPWTAVTDFHGAGPDDPHHTLDPRTGDVRVGDGRFGRVLPPGAANVRITYRTGGGAAGNRAAGTITTLASAVPYVDAVTNHEPAQGGYGGEPLERLRARGPQALRHGDRAVTAQDVEDIAFSAAPEVARVRAVLPEDFDPLNLWLDPGAVPSADHTGTDAGRFGVIVVPDGSAARPAPSLALLRHVEAHLRARCPVTAEVWVAGPEWVRVRVVATVVATAADVADELREQVRAALDRHLHPLTGGRDGTGWAFGRKPHRSELLAVVEGLAGADHVRALDVELTPESEELGARLQAVLASTMADTAAQPPAADLRRWLDRSLVYAGGHAITVTLR
ncbi:MAG: putative baseplate assembly protein [Pseudonocardia sp.]